VPRHTIFAVQGELHGFSRARHHFSILHRQPRFAGAVPTSHGVKMSLFYGLAGLITLALFFYLIFALLKPEWFE
jgi:K+-transporting ATPase KdpF subunit